MGANHETGQKVAGPERGNFVGPRFGSPPMAVSGHPSGKAHKQPQYIVMRYNGQALLCHSIVVRYITMLPHNHIALRYIIVISRANRRAPTVTARRSSLLQGEKSNRPSKSPVSRPNYLSVSIVYRLRQGIPSREANPPPEGGSREGRPRPQRDA